MANEQHRFQQSEVAEVLRLAMELDAMRKDSMTISEISSIAEELGTSQWAVDQAVQELGTVRMEPSVDAGPWKDRVSNWTHLPTLSGVIGVAAAAVMIVKDVSIGGAHDTGVIGVGLTAAASFLLANVVRGRNRHKVFQLSNLALWVSFACAASLGWPAESEGIFGLVSRLLVVSAGLGALISELHYWFRESRQNGAGSDGGKVATFFARNAKRVKEWVQKIDVQFMRDQTV